MSGTAKGGGGLRRLRIEQLEPRLALDASMLRITEFLASNSDGIRDADGDSSDWIEVFNAGSETVDLSGMYLTDDDDNLTEWQFPDGIVLPAGGYLLVFASNKDVVLPGGEIHTDFAISAAGEFLALVDTDGVTILDQYAPEFPPQLEDISYGRAMQPAGAPTTVLASGAVGRAIVPTSGALGLSWTEADFNDAAWPYSGQTGFGYENNPGDPFAYTSLIDTTLPSGTLTAYIRVPFELASLTGIGKLTLRMKFDDGFVAYINGEKVAEFNAPDAPQWYSEAAGLYGESAAHQFLDFDVSQAIPHLRVGTNVLAIHALNDNPGSSDFLILPELMAQPMALVTPESIGHFFAPTPGYGNGLSVAGFAAEPTFDVPHGFYSTPQTVAISTSTPGATIVYTTDGSTPQVDANLNVINGTLYVNPLTISSTTTLRARAFRATYEPSYVEASSYIFVDDVINQSPNGQAPPGWPSGQVNSQVLDYGIDPDIIALYGAQAVKDSLLSISTFSITTDLANLFDPSIGIYVNAGARGRSWERPASVELIFPDGTPGFEVDAGLRIRGGFSRSGNNPKHAFRFFFRGEEYGEAKLHYPLFGDEGVAEFDRLDLRTSQNYSWSFGGDAQNTFEREVWGRDLQRDLGLPYTRSRYHHLYINGVYWGLFQSQEKVEEFFGESYLGGQEEDYDVIVASNSYTTEAEVGNDAAWRQLFDYAQALQASPQTNANLYWTMQGLNPDGTRNESLPVLLDVDALIDYVLIIFYTGGFDSGLSRFLGDERPNNWFGIYNRVTADRGFQFFIHDNEHSLGVAGTSSIDRTGPFNNNGGQDNYLFSNPQYLHQDLMAHPEYKQRFIDHVQKYFFNDGPMTPAANIARLDERVAESEPAIIAEAARWGDAKRHPPLNKSNWQAQINFLRLTYFPQRGNLVLDQLRGDGLFTNFSAPLFSQHGGTVPNNYALTITSTSPGTIYYSTDGITDPRAIGGAVNPSSAVTAYTGPINITGSTTVKARLRTTSGQWSGLVEATFDTPRIPGDYDNSGLVDNADYLAWRASFGNTVPAGTLADGSGNGVIDAADYVVWRKNVGLAAAATQSTSETTLASAVAQSSSLDTATESRGDESDTMTFDRFAVNSDQIDSARPLLRNTAVRPVARGPLQQSARDLLMVASISLDSDLIGDVTVGGSASAALSAEVRALDELFSTMGDDFSYGLGDLLESSPHSFIAKEALS